MEEEEEKNATSEGMEIQYCSSRIMSPEIVEIVEDNNSVTTSRSEVSANDVYVAVGKDDLDVLKWALDHAVSPGARVFLVHVFPPITYIPTPVGKLSKSQLSKEQVRVYINEEHNRRRNLLQKYIRLCNEAKVTVDTVLLESNMTAKAILELITVLNITNLVVGTKRTPCSRVTGDSKPMSLRFNGLCSSFFRRLGKKMAKGKYIKMNAPEFCEVTIVHDGKKVVDNQQVKELVHSSLASNPSEPEIASQSERNFFECVCFSGKFN